MTIPKQLTFKEKYNLQFAGTFFNIMNHPQYVAGNISDVAPIGFTSTAVHNSRFPPIRCSAMVASLFEQSAEHPGLGQADVLD